MSVFDVSQLTLNPTEVQEASELIVEKLWKKGRLAELFDIQTGIGNKTQIVGVKRIPIGGGAPSDGNGGVGCIPKAIGNIATTQKYWDPAIVTGRLTYCAQDENRLFKILQKWTNVYPDFFEKIPDDVQAMIVALLLDHIETSVIAKAFFSDTAADTVTNGGVFEDGTDLSVFNQIDGIWKEVFADTSIPKYTIAKNAGATYADQKITNDEAYEAIESVFDEADERLKSDPEAIIYVTSDLFWGYAKKLAAIEASGGFTKTIIGGRQALQYMGKTIVNMVDWTEVIKTYQNDGTKYNLPHRIIFTVKENMPIGTMDKKDLAKLRNDYSVDQNAVLTDYGYSLDANFLESYLMSVAY